MKLFDSHTHVGRFHECYFTPADFINICKQVGITDVGVSSSTMADEDFDLVFSEMKELVSQNEVTIHPVLWISPKMLNSGAITRFIESGIKWCCVKVHNYQQRGQWGDSLSPLMLQATDLARQLNVPLLFHCGNEMCMPDDYEPLIAATPDVKFVIAHSRPVDQTIRILSKYPNAYADTAFAPTEDILKMFKAGVGNRVMWGTDIPVMSYYYSYLDGKKVEEFDYKTYCFNMLNKLREKLTEEEYLALTYNNAYKLYNR